MAYLEHDPCPDLTDVVACTWQRAASAAGRHRVLPDGCVDLVWRGGALTVAGPDTAAWMSPLEQAVAARRAGMDEPDRLVSAPTRTLGWPRGRVRAVGGASG